MRHPAIGVPIMVLCSKKKTKKKKTETQNTTNNKQHKPAGTVTVLMCMFMFISGNWHIPIFHSQVEVEVKGRVFRLSMLGLVNILDISASCVLNSDLNCLLGDRVPRAQIFKLVMVHLPQ